LNAMSSPLKSSNADIDRFVSCVQDVCFCVLESVSEKRDP